MSSDTKTNIQYQELDFTKSEDLEVFLDSAEDVYTDALVYEADAKSEGYKRLADKGVSGSEIFVTLSQKLSQIRALVSKCRDVIIPRGDVIDDSLVDNMQQLYDDMILLRNHVREAYENNDYEIESSPVVREDVDLVQSDEVLYFKVENSDEINDSEGDDIFVTAEKSLKLVADKVSVIKSRISALFSQLEKTDEILIDLKELDICEKRVQDLVGRVEDSKNSREDESVLKNNINRYIRVGLEIEKTAHNIEEVLLAKKSGVNYIRTAETTQLPDTVKEIGLSKFDELNEQEYEEDIERLTPDIRRKDIDIKSDDQTDGLIHITVVKKTREGFELDHQAESVSEIGQQISSSEIRKPMIVSQEDVRSSAPIIAELEKTDPINKAIPGRSPTITHAKLVHEQTSLTRNYLNNGRYRVFIKNHYTSPAAFERMLDTAVTQIESKTVDAIERFFGDTYASPFAFIQEMSVGEVLDFSARQDVRSELSAREIKYETFVAWMDLIDEMQEVVGVDLNMEFGELFARWIIETEIAYYQVEEAVS